MIALVRGDEVPSMQNPSAAMERLVKIAQRVTLLEEDRKQIELTAGR